MAVALALVAKSRTHLKFLGDGALSWFASKPLPGPKWQVRKHGVQGRRQWRKVHIAMDPATSDVRAVEFTPSRDGDSPVLPELLDQVPQDEPIGTVTADGAYDTRRCHTAAFERDAVPIIPIRKNGRPWKDDGPAARVRNESLRVTRHYGRAFWRRWTGYHIRSRIEEKMRCFKANGMVRPAALGNNRWISTRKVRRCQLTLRLAPSSASTSARRSFTSWASTPLAHLSKKRSYDAT